ncbi:hypothetical protein PSACC_01374 [Paramicrosporidium saccamoebae]|uniref:Ubiquitin-like-conjugating enzyme ATG10 n=1 Tax=Paramicrosporidium saccamoebae TaxID=1246581 RepID=A0A2H9TM26_9FUNG|nr:hypothetical protein PSACC_01374 [Paramicrosporidium saccamoebae]
MADSDRESDGPAHSVECDFRSIPALEDPISAMRTEEFEEAVMQLVAWTREYNLDAKKTVSISAVDIHKCYATTSSVYLQLDNDVQVFYSPSFQVPVLYFPYNTKSTEFGEGKISYTEHPITGLPCLFLHPCQTAAVMKEMPFVENYLWAWLAVYVKDVPALTIPMEFFSKSPRSISGGTG